jgi:hypothetical protein
MKYYLQTYTPRVKKFQSTDDPMNHRVISRKTILFIVGKKKTSMDYKNGGGPLCGNYMLH